MNIDTAEYMMLRGEVNGLNEAVAELARRQRQHRREVQHELGAERYAIANLAIAVADAIDAMRVPLVPQLGHVDGGRSRGTKPHRWHLQLLR